VGQLAPSPRRDVGRVTDPLRDRRELAAAFSGAGLTDDAPRLAEAATCGLQLVPADARSTRSRLGGPALLPGGRAWPRDRRGRPLTFLAGIDLAELDDFDERHVLPAGGWLLAFADIATEEAEGLVEESGNDEGDVARVFVVSDVVAADPPSDLQADANHVLRHRPVAARRTLMLPDDYEAADRLGIDEDVYDRALEALDKLHRQQLGDAPKATVAEGAGVWMGPEDTPRTDDALVRNGWRRPDDGRSLDGLHWMGGAATGVQGEPPGGTILLLGVSWDEALGLLFLDGGSIQFRIPPDAAERGDWSQVRALPASC
jgi:hypothetical protein